MEHAIGVRRSAHTILKQMARPLPTGALWRGDPRADGDPDGPRPCWPPLGTGLGAWGLLCLGIPSLLCASHLSVSVVSWVATRLVAPRTLPRMEFSEGIPPEARTLVVVPTMLTSAAGVRDSAGFA